MLKHSIGYFSRKMYFRSFHSATSSNVLNISKQIFRKKYFQVPYTTTSLDIFRICTQNTNLSPPISSVNASIHFRIVSLGHLTNVGFLATASHKRLVFLLSHTYTLIWKKFNISSWFVILKSFPWFGKALVRCVYNSKRSSSGLHSNLIQH